MDHQRTRRQGGDGGVRPDGGPPPRPALGQPSEIGRAIAEVLAKRSRHALRDRIERARRLSGLSMGKLSVLSRSGTPTGSTPRRGTATPRGWPSRSARLAIRLPIHLRGLHYGLVVPGDVVKPDGEPYLNDDDNWVWLSEVAAKAARWLGYVRFEDIVDERNEAPVIFVPEEETPYPFLGNTFDFSLPDPGKLLPRLTLDGFQPRQPYRLVFVGEKTSLRAVLEPVARAFGAEMILPTGETSDTLIEGIAARAAIDGRPTQVLYFADFDPAGWQMATSVARKLQALQDLFPISTPITVRRAGLLPEQVRSLGLPSTPLKASEKRADGWRARWDGLEQTEIDALTTLRPEELRRIAIAAVAPFYDRTLARRANEARAAWEAEANEVLAASIDPDVLRKARARLERLTATVEPELQQLQGMLEVDVDELTLPPVPDVEPETDGLPPAPPPLWDSEDDWTEATLRLAADKAHGGGEP